MPKGNGAASPAASNDELQNTEAVETVETVVAEPDANAAASSTADEPDANKEPASLLDVVKDAVAPPAEKAPEASSPPDGDQEKPEAGAEPAKAEEASADDSDLPFHTHPRWQQVIAENNELKADAERARNIDAYLENGGVPPEMAAEVLQVTVLARSGDPAKIRQARDYVQGQLDGLNGLLGTVLPDDLRDRIEDGEIDEETARELAEARATTRLHVEAEQRRTERSSTAQAEEEAKALGARMATAVIAWENEVRKTDPDYAKKEALIRDTAIATMHREGRPKTEAEAVALTQRAYKEVDAAMRAALPKPKPVDTTTPAGSSATATAAPTSLRAAIDAALAA